VTLRSYLEAVALLAVVLTPIAFASIATRRRLVPGWTGASARLAELIVGVSVLTVVSETIGSVGWFRRIPLMIGAITAGVALFLLCRRGPAPTRGNEHAEATPRWGVAAALCIAATVVIQWMVLSRPVLDTGVISNDSRQYHLPLAANFVQSGWLSRFSFLWIDPTATFYPANGELVHAVGILAFGNDTLSVPMNIAWLALALLAAWCVGQPFGAGHLTLGATAVLMSTPQFAAGQVGSALNDTTLLAFLLAMLAFLLRGGRARGPMVLAGLAAGLAVGTKYTGIAPVAAATVVVVLSARRSHRLRTSIAWLGPCVLTGGYWYVRNTVRIGNPVPQVIRLLPHPRFPSLEAYGARIVDYAIDGAFWRDVVPDGLRTALGPLWVVVVVLCGIGMALTVVALMRRDTRALLRSQAALLAATAGVAGVAYLAAAGSAYGPPGEPFLFGLNVRYGLPAFCIALIACTLAVGSRVRLPLFVGLTLCTAANLIDDSVTKSIVRSSTAWMLAAAALGVAAVAWLARNVVPRRIRSSRSVLALTLALAFVFALGAGRKLETHYLERRYTTIPIGSWARTVRDARIGVVGLPEQYPLFGLDLSNHVTYIGQREPHGGFHSITDCNAFRAAVVAGHFDFVVAGTAKWSLEPAPELEWVSTDPGATDLHIAGSRLTGADVLGVYQIDDGSFRSPCR